VRGTSGNEFLCRCPWHNDKGKPNLYVNGVKGLYFCQACGVRGHLRKIASQLPAASTEDVRDRLKLMAEKASNQRRVYPEAWLKRFDNVHSYWEKRGFSEASVARFQLGYDPMANMLTIPVRDPRGQLLGVLNRVLDNTKPKYRYPKGFPISNHLFASWLITEQRKVAIVEGSLDAIACWDAKVPALGLFGSRLSEKQALVLIRLGIEQVVIFTDNDEAGQGAIPQISEALHGSGILCKVAVYRSYWNAKDPGELRPDQIKKAFHSADFIRSRRKAS
jgi:DNA primase